MTLSMTGFAREDLSAPWGEMSIELRAVNHRFLELSLRLPEQLRALDPVIRKRVGAAVSRGKLDLSVKLSTQSAAEDGIHLNEALVEQLILTGNELAKRLGSEPLNASTVMRWPGVVVEPPEDIEAIRAGALGLIDTVLAQLVEHRASEGGRLAQMLLDRCKDIEALVAKVRESLPAIREAIRARLHARLEDLAVDADEGRLEAELAIMLGKADVDEELDRLDSHLVEVRDILNKQEPVGRKLDFLMQEFNREANTLGSKAQDASTTKAAVDLKVLIEQMREQVQNIE